MANRKFDELREKMRKKAQSEDVNVGNNPLAEDEFDLFDVGIDDIFRENKKRMPKRPGAAHSSVSFTEFRIKGGWMEIDYIFTTGNAHLTGTMKIRYHRKDPLGQVCFRLVELGEEAFERVRRTRD
jgi:hypothetical protein